MYRKLAKYSGIPLFGFFELQQVGVVLIDTLGKPREYSYTMIVVVSNVAAVASAAQAQLQGLTRLGPRKGPKQ